jgi:hypothetical protein
MPDSRAWKQLYVAAILESNPTKLEQIVHDCEGAIYLRMHDINGDARDAGERVEIATAIAGLLDLKINKLGWSDLRSVGNAALTTPEQSSSDQSLLKRYD